MCSCVHINSYKKSLLELNWQSEKYSEHKSLEFAQDDKIKPFQTADIVVDSSNFPVAALLLRKFVKKKEQCHGIP